MLRCGDIVFYSNQGVPCIGKLARKYDVDKWVIVPFQGNRIILRKPKYIRQASEFKKYIDIDKNI